MDISELRKEPHLSASSINDYIDCSLLYNLVASISFRLNFVHPTLLNLDLSYTRSLKSYYRQKLEGNLLSAKDLHQLFEKAWRETAEGKEDIRYLRRKRF